MPENITEVDARGMNCPMPLLKAKQALNKLSSGQLLRVLATDSGSWRDFEVFCKQSGNTLVESREEEGLYTYIIARQQTSA